MTVYSKYNIIYRLQRWLDSVPGQTFMNYAYSWGAAVVILGTLFKLTHLPGANFMLYVGMGTEVLVFFLSAFDRPFDKTAIGKELPTHLDDEEEDDEAIDDDDNVTDSETETNDSETEASGGQTRGTETVIIGGGGGGTVIIGGSGGGQIAPQAAFNEELEEAQGNYIDELKKLTEMLAKVGEQSERLTRDSEEMENLNRTLTGISRVYEMQLKGASQQIGTIDEINEQSRRMAEQIAELNRIYARMIEAMTVNARAAGGINPTQE